MAKSWFKRAGLLVAVLTGVAVAAVTVPSVIQLPGTHHETFHFVLNNIVIKDNRIPPYGFNYDSAKVRNTLPVPAAQYGGPGPGGTYRYWDEVILNPPVGAMSATIQMLYQPTSWEYIQFLYLANNRTIAFLADEGVNLLDAWVATGMAEPHAMVSVAWFPIPGDANLDGVVDLQDFGILKLHFGEGF